MGKRNSKNSGAWKKGKRTRADTWQSEGAIVRENPLFEQYYRLQKIVPDEEFDSFMETLVGNGLISHH